MKIQGANLGEQEVEYRLLSEYPFFKGKRQEVVKKLEQLYLNLQEESKKTEVKPFPQKDGKVEILPGMLNHRCSKSLECLRTLAQYGILASEWFGQIESEREGVFCAFVDRIHEEEQGDERRQSRASSLNRQRLKSARSDILLFLDDTNPVMQQLLHLDYFEYEKVKQETPEKLSELYSPEEREILDTIIEPFSPGGKTYHTKDFLPYCDWSAIPGGIPATLVNGICTKNKIYEKEYLDEVSQLFPNATIFNGDLEILVIPKREKSTQELGKETLEEQEDTRLLDEIEQAQTRLEKGENEHRGNE